MLWIPTLCILVLSSWFERAYGFGFVVSIPTECGLTRFTWVGGTPPFRALIIPPGSSITNVSIPVSSWNDKDQSGDFSMVLPLPAGASVVFSISDATGVTAGGVTDLMTVGSPTAGSPKCNTSDPGTDFIFNLDGMLSQCKPYPFTRYTATGAIQPVAILVAVPHGESFLLHPPVGDTFNWIANITAETSVTFSMMDAQNRIGGSVIRTVGSSDDSSCLQPIPSYVPPTNIPTPSSIPPTSIPTASSVPLKPISTASSLPIKPISTATPLSSPANTHGNDDSGDSDSNQKSNKTGGIIGAVGGATALLIIAALVYYKGRRRLNAENIELVEPGSDSSTYLLDSQQQDQNPRAHPYPPYQDEIIHQVGAPSTVATPYNDTSLESPVSVSAAGVPKGAAAPMWTYQLLDHAMGADQWGAMDLQPHYDPYEMSSGSSVAGTSSAAYPSFSGRPVSQSVSENQFGAEPASNYSTSVGPRTSLTGQSGKRLSSASQPSQAVIVHPDVEDEPTELPPAYSES